MPSTPRGDRFPHVPQEPSFARSTAGPDAAGDGAAMREYIGIIARQKWLVLGITLVAATLAGYKAYTDPALYTSAAVIRFVDPQTALTGGLGGEMLGRRLGGDAILSQIQVLKSRTVMGMVVDETGLRLQSTDRGFHVAQLEDVQVDPSAPSQVVTLTFGDQVQARSGSSVVSAPYGSPIAIDGVRFTVPARPDLESVELTVVPREAAAMSILNALNVAPRERTDVIDVSYTTTDSRLAQEVVNAVGARFREYNADLAQQEARRRREFLQERLAYTDSLLLEAQRDLTDFRAREQVLSSRERFAAQQAGLMELDLQREQIRADLQTYRSILARLADRDVGERDLQALLAAPGLSSNLVIAQIYGQLDEYQLRRDTMTAGTFATARTDPNVVRLEELIATTQARLIDAVGSHVTSLEARLVTLDEIRARRADTIELSPTIEAEEVRLQTEMDQIGTMAMQLREEYQRAQMIEAVEAGQVEILDPALPGVPSPGHRIRTLLFGIALGLFLGGGTAVIWERNNTSIRRKDEIERTLEIPELAIIPSIAGLVHPVNRLRLPVRIFGNGNGNGAHPPAHEANELIAATNSKSPGAEAYRTLRTNLIFSQTIEKLKTIVVTSSAPGEGKSTTAANLAVTFAQQGLRVLLVDCDLRKARLHRVFKVPREPGLTQLVLGYNSIPDVIRESGIENLWVLPSGTLPPNPAELVGGPRLKEVLEELGMQFDLILIDSPPILAASDAAMLGTVADGVLLVVRAGQTERDAASQAVQKLHIVGARILGAVLNDPDSKVGRHGGYYAYEYYGAES